MIRSLNLSEEGSTSVAESGSCSENCTTVSPPDDYKYNSYKSMKFGLNIKNIIRERKQTFSPLAAAEELPVSPWTVGVVSLKNRKD